MSGPIEPDRKALEPIISFDERIDLLFDELSFAIQWQRPSILLVFYDSESVQKSVEIALEKRMAEIGQKVEPFKVDEAHYDIALLLSRLPARDRSVYSITSLSRGGGKGGANAYRALNIRREYFVDYAMRVIFWLTGNEPVELARHAPDFWAFRHRVVEFYDLPDNVQGELSVSETSGSDQAFTGQFEDLHEQARQLEAMIADLPDLTASLTKRLDLLAKGALIYREAELYDRAIRYLKQAVMIAKQQENALQLAKLWGTLGSIYLDLDRLKSGIRAYRKAIRYSPAEPALRIGLGHVYRKEQRYSDAIMAYKHACRLDPQNASANSSLVACYRLMGKDKLSESYRKKVIPFMEKETVYNRAVYECVSGNTSQAVVLLAYALDEKQVGVNEVRRDPNFDSLKADPEYLRLLKKYGRAYRS